MSYHPISQRRHRAGLGSVLDPVVQQLERTVKAQVDRALDVAGDRASRYLDSSDGQRLLNKFETKVETALVNVARKRKADIVLAGVSFAAFTAAAVALGSKIDKRGVQAAMLIGLAAAMPLVLSDDKKVV